MSRYHAPPPTKFGPARPSQAKPGIAASAIQHVAPATRFGPAGLAPPRPALQRMENSQGKTMPTQQPVKSINNPDDELCVYENLVLTKLSGKSVETFAEFLEGSALFGQVLKTGEKITIITGFHGGDGDGGMPGGWVDWFSDEENKRILSSKLAKFVTLKIIDKKDPRYQDEKYLKSTLALDIVRDTSGGGRVFYAWCYSNYVFKYINPGAQLMTF